MKTRIRLNSTNSVNSVIMDNKVAVELQQTTKPLIYTSLKDDVDQYEVFLQERNLCNKYRLICTINPYCTNVLFNPVTEIIKIGTNKYNDKIYKIITDESSENIENSNVYGKNEKVNRYDMIKNTEYSREDIGYIYYPGTDIFNNHLLRNKSFKIVNPLKTKNSNDDFNTIRDFARTYDGKDIEFFNRFGDDAANPTAKPKHLYIFDDVMNITDSINNNLMEENGWFGFVNKTTILAKSKGETTILAKSKGKTTIWKDEDYNHVINNKESCEFIDLYPDRTLFSFNPKYNDVLKRPEYNWKYCLTYPYENFYNHKLIKDKNGDGNYINALFINDVKFGINGYGEYVLFFNTLCKHNLKAGSIINLYFKNEKNSIYDVIKTVNIRNIGDMDLNNNDYCFYVNANILSSLNNKDINDLYENIYESSTNEAITNINNVLSNFVFRFKQVINGYESEYYIRIFHKLPNLIKNEKQLTLEKANNTIILDDDFLCKESCELTFDNEQYPLAFSSTIYNDKKTQIVFTDGIDIENLLDNRGRPVSEIFLTIIKNNKGNKKWYAASADKKNKSVIMDEVEYSHCFSEVSCGFDLKYDIANSCNCSDIKTITTNGIFGWDNVDIIINDITEDSNKFIGDIVEFNIGNCNEIVLEDCFFRFNTYLREHISDFQDEYHFNYDDLISDDYDVVGFEVKLTQYAVKPHREGYYYKAHYNIKLKEYGDKIQDSHYELKIKDVYLDSFGEDVCLFIQTSLPHRLNLGEVVMLFDDEREQMLQAKVLYIKNVATFAIGSIGQLTCHNLMRILKGEFTEITFKLRRYNTDIPFYAEKVPHRNIYMWRELNGVGNLNNTSLPEYTFNNGYLYINQDINFYLRRQDPFDETGLYYYGENNSVVPNDVYGNTLQTNNYEYKTEAETTC